MRGLCVVRLSAGVREGGGAFAPVGVEAALITLR